MIGRHFGNILIVMMVLVLAPRASAQTLFAEGFEPSGLPLIPAPSEPTSARRSMAITTVRSPFQTPPGRSTTCGPAIRRRMICWWPFIRGWVITHGHAPMTWAPGMIFTSGCCSTEDQPR